MKKLTALLLALALCLGLAACGSSQTPASGSGTGSASGSGSAAQSADTSARPDGSAAADSTESTGADVNLAVLSGPTGIGASPLMGWNDEGKTANHYNVTVAAANDEVVAGLTNGDFDIAAVATNVAANLYAKTNGGVQICALNTYGVLYILENGDSIQSMADLAGKTIYATGQGANPEYVLEYLLDQNGLTWSTDGSDADVQIEFMDAQTLSAGAASGEYDVVMLPVPAVTSVQLQNADMRTALDLTAEWNKLDNSGVLTMGCIVVRTAFAQEHPEAVDAFLQEYGKSIEAVQSDVDTAAQLCETYGIVAKAAVAKKAIPDCNLCFVSGAEIQSAIEPYYNVLFTANPASIGGAMPGSDFYYVSAASNNG
ncbi:MAG: ABC transporter substrate-binding protein [Eubacteriales bacterium]|nr:ABC transporter substrate-binding protein [Eubacteriales bacterium]